ncbi:SgrR family transcriptional regulator [Erwinia sp. INIA-01]|uniref:SgrR family transcriptional regulator n=1 Tax=Erwinia sp. INIA01 TaxID=2991500 RepID=UPI0022246C99|nr:SgrR family transcriptional regulator [Erwinia sp. INIA01]MCW1876186.1 SgrR family transcriptional regulator [Erwinia sp. INIA01]
MYGQRLEYHYLRLLTLFPAREAETTLQALADSLCCSKRHMRALLVKMHNEGWLNWQAAPGRGRQAQLRLLRDEQQLKVEKADRLLETGNLAAVVELLGEEKSRLASLLRTRLGYRISDDYQSLRIPYYREMLNLYPGTPLRRSENHLVRQIFSGLTRINPQSGEVECDLAHRWRQLDALRWRFFLRRGVRFHDGREMTSEDVISSLTRSAALPLFSHIKRVEAAGALSVIVELHYADDRLPLLLTDPAALILPADHSRRDDFAAHPIGTGPYRVIENDRWHLKMQAFEHYFGLRGLLDEVELIVWPDVAHAASSEQFIPAGQPAAWLSSSISDIAYVSGEAEQFTGKPSEPLAEMFLEQGGYFLLCDSRSGRWQTPERRRWLREILSPWQLASQLVESIRPLWVPTGSLLPAWFHCMDEGSCLSPFSADENPLHGAVLRLACHRQHPEYAMLTGMMRKNLAAEGIALEVIELDYQQWASGEAEVDLWLGTVNFPAPEQWNVGAWLLGMPLLQPHISGGDPSQYQRWQQQWRNGTLESRQLVQQVVGAGWLQPLFHHWMRLKAPENAQGIRLNNLGWFDFQSTWMEPE